MKRITFLLFFLILISGVHHLAVASDAFNSKIIYMYLFVFFFLGLHSWHMEVPRLGVESEL